MSFLSALYTLIIYPLELLFEVVFTIANRIIGNPGLSIIFLSLAFNFLVLPLYKRADELQKEERDMQSKMAYRIGRIKKAFKGDERFMMLQEYYRIMNYKPVYALKSSVSLMLQIPFFIAAYRLLSRMQCLQGIMFGPITDLGSEDAMFMIGSFPVNVLPVLMTLINIISGIIYTKGQPLKSKIQVYGLAAVFLILLYHSPSGLVFYWLLNNVFSLVKNIFYKLKNPKKVLNILFAAAGIVLLIAVILKQGSDLRQKILLGTGAILLTLPLISGFIKMKPEAEPAVKSNKAFFAGTVLMALITGLLIPSSVISASSEEFIDVLSSKSPVWYIVSSLLLAFGSWVLWGNIFCFFMSSKMKNILGKAIWIICGVSVLDYMLFGTKLGTLSSTLQYDSLPSYKLTDYLINALAVAAASVILGFIFSKWPKLIRPVLIAGILTVTGLGIYNTCKINSSFRDYHSRAQTAESPVIPLSRNGTNVVVLMLDRSVGDLVPYILEEKPELKAQFDGFTYYPNTISFGAHTNTGSPALFGGYEYTPERMNERDTELLEDKHNEALKVMPAIFGGNGYEVTVIDPPYAGYNWIPDLSIYDNYPDFNCYLTVNQRNFFGDSSILSDEASGYVHEIRNRNFFLYSLMKISPVILQETVYDGGIYNTSRSTGVKAGEAYETDALVQHISGISRSIGYDINFLEAYAALSALSDITEIDDGTQNNFLMMANKTTHSPSLLQEPDYVPAYSVDNTEYDTDLKSRYDINGRTLTMNSSTQVTHYQINMAAFLQLGKWFDYLREQGVYDNTRIILVADHAYALDYYKLTCNNKDMTCFLPLLMVKDFNATGYTVSEDFMTNADTPALATEGLIDDPVNPFTGIPIIQDYKSEPQTVFLSDKFKTTENNGTTYLEDSWYTVSGDPHKSGNWKFLGIW